MLLKVGEGVERPLGVARTGQCAGEIALQAALRKQTTQASQQNAHSCHGRLSVGFRNRAMMVLIRSQFSASAASCFLPARVIE